MGFRPFYWQRWAKIVFSEARPQTNQSSEMRKEGEDRASWADGGGWGFVFGSWENVAWKVNCSGEADAKIWVLLNLGTVGRDCRLRWGERRDQNKVFSGSDVIPERDGLKEEKCKETKIYAAPALYQGLWSYRTSILRNIPTKRLFYFQFKAMETEAQEVYETWPKFKI